MGVDIDGAPGDGVLFKDLANPVEIRINLEFGGSITGFLTEHGFTATGQMQFSYGDIQIGEVAVFQPADFEKDGDVDGDDFLLWQTGFGQFDPNTNPATMGDGDADLDGDVDGDDFLMWQSQFGTGDGSGSGAVPEPSSLALVVLGLLAGLGIRRR